MLTLSVVAVEDGVLIAASAEGDRFRIPVDLDVETRLRERRSVAGGPRITPREIQAHVRAGLSAQQVAALTGAPIAYVERFTGPVLAELAYVVDTALGVRVEPEDPDAVPRTFRAVMSERLAALDATAIVWSSCREVAGGWVIVLDFVADEIQHEARWRFEPKRQLLTPDNVEASTLSQAGTPVALTPRLRALEQTGPVPLPPQSTDETDPELQAAPSDPGDPGDPGGAPSAPVRSLDDRRGSAPTPTRFDSAAFRFPSLAPSDGEAPADDEFRTAPDGSAGAADPVTGPSTDLLAALTHQRGRRDGEPASPIDEFGGDEDDEDDPFRSPPRPDRDVPAQITRGRFPEALPPAQPKPAPQPLKRPRTRVGRRTSPATPSAAPEPAAERSTATRGDAAPSRPVAVPPPAPVPTVRPRRGRTTMPSWDEIVYGKDED